MPVFAAQPGREAYFAGNLNVAAAAKALSLHPNSLRSLLELVAAARLAGPAAVRPDWSV